MKKTVIGIVAHVDAGKTTLSEGILYLSKKIRKLGRVDKKDSFFDYHDLERNRGITIFSKEARFKWNDVAFTLIDTPGHVDFSGEMERTLQILDYAILVINGLDGIQMHTQTIWKLLDYYHIPTFLFVNKMDQAYQDKAFLMDELKNKLDANCNDFMEENTDLFEQIALLSEQSLEYYLTHHDIKKESIQDFILERKLFPCFFGSALKLDKVDYLLDQISYYIKEKQYPDQFQAIVYKITRDHQNNKLTHIKLTGGSLKVKTKIKEEKVDQIRIYSGNKYEMVQEVDAGEICTIKGLKQIQVGEYLGSKALLHTPVLTSYISYQVQLEKDVDKYQMLQHLEELSQEDPLLQVYFDPQTDEIRVQLMGEIQIEILKQIIYERFHKQIEFSQGKVVYKESILEPVYGIGHYEPLRHYAEVCLLLEPGKPGSGLQFISKCKEDVLSRNYQNLIMSHLKEKQHVGVLTGSNITDIKITLLSGKAHLKHTSGGDFREATYRALRQGLKMAKCVLLEPYGKFQLEIPYEYRSKAIFAIEKMKGTYSITNIDDKDILVGTAPISKMQEYQRNIINDTKGKGKLSCSFSGYQPCIDQEDIIKEINYDSETDTKNPTGSIFCHHGSSFYVKWNEVANYMHLKNNFLQEKKTVENNKINYLNQNEEAQLEEIFLRTYGPTKKRVTETKKIINNETKNIKINHKPECLLVDGYNVIHAWKNLKDLAKDNLDAARSRLIDMMCNYQGYRGCMLILVFDAYKVKENLGTMKKYHNIYIVYTKEAQTADMYIEHASHEMAGQYQITVATSDALEQLIVSGQGAIRISSRELEKEVERLHHESFEDFNNNHQRGYNYLLEDIKDFQNK